MPIPLLGFVIVQLGLRAIPVLLRSGSYAMRYLITTPGTKGTALRELGKRVLGKNAVVDDLAKLTSKAKDNPISKIIDPKTLAASERNTLMNTVYKDSSKLLQSQKSWSLNAKLAGDIQKGFGQGFSKEFASRQFIAGDRVAIATKEVLKKVAAAPKGLPRPITSTAGDAAKIAKARISAGMGLTKEAVKQVPKEARKQIVKLHRATEKLKTAAKGTETGPVIAEGLRGVGTVPKPAWWQGVIPTFLRVGGQAYKGAYPGAVSGPRVGTTAGGLLFGSIGGMAALEELEKKRLEAKDILSAEQIMNMASSDYTDAYDPNAAISNIESANVILPERIE